MNGHYHSVNELAGLPGLPGTGRGVQIWADREQIPYRKREKSGGGREYAESALPKAAQKALQQRRALAEVRQIEAQIAASTIRQSRIVDVNGPEIPAAPATPNPLPVPAPVWHEADLRDWQRRVRDARHGVCTALLRRQQQGLSLQHAYASLLHDALAAGPDSVEYCMLVLAKDHRGRLSVGMDAMPSFRSVQRWLQRFGDLVAIAPKTIRKPFVMPPWGKDFLACWQVPQKVSVEQAYTEYLRHLPESISAAEIPSIHQVRRLIDKLPAIIREKGRMGPRELKNIKPFVRRTFAQLWPNDVWSADGHTFDAEVQHPLTGKPFRPEITTIVDIATRRIAGFSIGLAESALAVVDALRHAAMLNGCPALFYVDNGSGYANEMLESDAVGLAARLGFEVKHSLPYNSQARGVIERLHRSVWVPMAKTLPSYLGDDMDREARQQNHKLTRPQKGGVVTRLPLAWDLFMRCCEDAIAAYHARPHHGLPKFADPVTGHRRHYSPEEWAAHRAQVCAAEGYAPAAIDPQDTDSLFRPRVARTVLRAEIKLFNNVYYAGHLADDHETTVQVGYDIHDPDRVWIYDESGRYLGTAAFHGNSKAYFPQSVIEQARDQRAAARVSRLDRKARDIEAERTGRPALEAIPAAEIPGMRPFIGKGGLQAATDTAPAALIDDLQARPKALSHEEPVYFPDASDGRARYQLWRELCEREAQGEALPEAYRLFVQSFPKSRVFRIWDEHFNGQTPAAMASGHY